MPNWPFWATSLKSSRKMSVSDKLHSFLPLFLLLAPKINTQPITYVWIFISLEEVKNNSIIKIEWLNFNVLLLSPGSFITYFHLFCRFISCLFCLSPLTWGVVASTPNLPLTLRCLCLSPSSVLCCAKSLDFLSWLLWFRLPRKCLCSLLIVFDLTTFLIATKNLSKYLPFCNFLPYCLLLSEKAYCLTFTLFFRSNFG